MNNGKKFEMNFKNSVPKDIFFYRFKDGTANWGTSDKSDTKFQASNMCDCMLINGGKVCFIELKNTKGKSLSLTRIRPNQLKELTRASLFPDLFPAIVVNFEEVGECYWLSIQNVNMFITQGERKSIPISFFQKHGFLIPSEKKKVNTAYDISVLFY